MGVWTPENPPPQWHNVGDIVGLSWEVVPFSMQGQVRAIAGIGRFPIADGVYRVASVAATVEDAPVGADLVLDVKVNGLSIYSGHPEDRPTIPDGGNTAVVGAHTDTTVAGGGYLNVDVLDVGTVLPGRFLVVAVRLQRIAG